MSGGLSPEPGSLADQTPSDPPVSAPGSQWLGAGRQAMLRLPTGLLVLVGVGFVLSVLLAYWAGLGRGYRRGQESVAAESRQKEAVHWKTHGALPVLSAMEGRIENSRKPFDLARPQGGDLREKGLNYFVLAHYPREDAQRLVGFLKQHGVESAAFRLHNKRLFQVIALKGFHRDNLYGRERREFERRMHELGRAWKAKHHGPDFSKTGIYLDLYETETIAETLIAKKEDPP